MITRTHAYDHRTIEPRWREHWLRNDVFSVPNPGDADFDDSKPKFFVLDMFPYTSGRGLHVGHPLGYIASDIVARHKRMTGFRVLHPMGYDAFGLPAEQYAVETGTHPRLTTERSIERIREQFVALGLSVDWRRELATIDPAYYRWTQWIFLQLYGSTVDPASGRARRVGNAGEPRLAYLAEVPVNWCPALGTVLANEEVTSEGRSERGNHPVYRRPLEQWMLRITAYADRLVDDLDGLDWPEPIKQMQRNWVGRSDGARVAFPVEGSTDAVEVFTTRPDTLFGATYVVLAPEHPLVETVTTGAARADVLAYRAATERRSEIDRQSDTRAKTGVFTGRYAINPASLERVPIWIADYVLMGYGTGAIMAVPAHDARDLAFARTFDLPIRVVVAPSTDRVPEGGALEAAVSNDGVCVSSTNDDLSLDGVPTPEARRRIVEWLEARGSGRAERQYKIRDWLFSRQRYWGEPFPILHGPDGEIRPVAESDLPVELPELADFEPRAIDDPDAPPMPSLSRAGESWRLVTIDGVTYERELNTMPQWAGSCWYYLRYLDPKNAHGLVGRDAERAWMQPNGVDLYIGGVEHAVLHLLYARFWHKVLHDLGHVSTPEPFHRLVNQGYIQAYAYTDARGVYVEAAKVLEERDGTFTVEGEPVSRSTLGKMGKSLKNAVTPDEIIEEYGCDTLRLYEMYMGPLEQSKPWNTRAIVGVHRFLQRLWRNLIDEESGDVRVTEDPPSEALRRRLHETIAVVSEDMLALRFNTAIARLIELNNELVGLDRVPREVAEPLVLMLSPLAPHAGEELWSRLGHRGSLAYARWPEADPRHLRAEEMELVVQVMGKKRSMIRVAADAGREAIEAAALGDPTIARHIEGRTVRRVIHVAGRLVNIVAS